MRISIRTRTSIRSSIEIKNKEKKELMINDVLLSISSYAMMMFRLLEVIGTSFSKSHSFYHYSFNSIISLPFKSICLCVLYFSLNS